MKREHQCVLVKSQYRSNFFMTLRAVRCSICTRNTYCSMSARNQRHGYLSHLTSKTYWLAIIFLTSKIIGRPPRLIYYRCGWWRHLNEKKMTMSGLCWRFFIRFFLTLWVTLLPNHSVCNDSTEPRTPFYHVLTLSSSVLFLSETNESDNIWRHLESWKDVNWMASQ